jgi:tetratricopeptide (TPR) repeat protein
MRLSASALGKDQDLLEADWHEFQPKASAWRALPVKPAISEEVRQHRLLAEHAVAEKQFDDAVEEYEAGLEINPTWPEGHFNAALLCAELRYYSEAIHHMRAYLELAPDAPDAQQARDQMIIWEAESKKAQ